MARPYKGHYLTEKQKQLAADNFPLVWWFIDQNLLRKNIIQNEEIDECAGHLIWHLCMSAENFKPEKGFKFSTYAKKGMLCGTHRYLSLKKRFREREILTDFTMVRKESHSQIVVDLEYVPQREGDVKWEDLEYIFGFIEMTPVEEQIMFFYYKQGYTFQKVGNLVGYSGENIRLIAAKVINKLKEVVQKNNLEIEDFITV